MLIAPMAAWFTGSGSEAERRPGVVTARQLCYLPLLGVGIDTAGHSAICPPPPAPS